MLFRKKVERVDAGELRVDPGLCPGEDERFDRLFEQAMKGMIPVYFAAVPLGLCIPADPDYRPDKHPVGAAAIQAALEAKCPGPGPPARRAENE